MELGRTGRRRSRRALLAYHSTRRVARQLSLLDMRHYMQINCNCPTSCRMQAPGASDEPMAVTFREVSTWSLWVRATSTPWIFPSPGVHQLLNMQPPFSQLGFELHNPATPDDMELLEAVLSSWFMIGRLGGYNAMNLQACQELQPSYTHVLGPAHPHPCAPLHTTGVSAKWQVHACMFTAEAT